MSENLEAAIRELRNDVKSLLTAQAGTTAKLDLIAQQSATQIGVLFDKRDADAERIRKIELDYVRQADFRRREEEHSAQHASAEEAQAKLDNRVTSIEAKVIKLGLLAGGIVAVIQAVGYALVRKFIG